MQHSASPPTDDTYPTLCRYQKTLLSEARIVFYGAGSSAVGVAEMIATYMQQVGAAGTAGWPRRGRLPPHSLLPAPPWLWLHHSAGVGSPITPLILPRLPAPGLQAQKAGISWGEARKRIYMVDSKG